MKWNQTKFQILRLGNNNSHKDGTKYYAPDGTKVIERKQSVKDLVQILLNMLSKLL